MTPEQAIEQVRAGKLRPVYVVTGEETYLVGELLRAIREAVVGDAVAGFNFDRFVATETDAPTAIAAAQTAPMMAKQRLVVVRGVERWESRGAGKSTRSPLSLLAAYADDPMPSTVLVLVASKLHGQRKLMAAAKKGGYAVTCKPLSRRELPGWIQRAAKERGHALAPQLAEVMAELLGPELGPVVDALERLSLFVGEGAPISEEAISQLVTRVRTETVWQLVDALGRRQLGRALACLSEAYDPREGGLPTLGAVGWSVRQLIKFEAARRSGASVQDAARQAGVPAFKVSDVEQAVGRLARRRLEYWLKLLAETDRALKSSRRSHQAVLESLVVQMCR